MFDYEKFLDTYRENGDGNLNIDYCGEAELDIGGSKEGLLYFASRILEFVEKDCINGPPAETDMDDTIDYEGNVRRICIFLDGKGVH